MNSDHKHLLTGSPSKEEMDALWDALSTPINMRHRQDRSERHNSLSVNGDDITGRITASQISTESLSIGRLEPEPQSITFTVGNNDVIRLEPNGNIYVHGNLTVNDMEVVEGMRDLIEGNRNV